MGLNLSYFAYVRHDDWKAELIPLYDMCLESR